MSGRIWISGRSIFWKNQKVFKRRKWRWMPLEWTNGRSDAQGGREKNVHSLE